MKSIKKIFSELSDDIKANKKLYAIVVPVVIGGLTGDITCAIHCTPYMGFCTMGGGVAGALLGWAAYGLYRSCAREGTREHIELRIGNGVLNIQSPPALADAELRLALVAEDKPLEENRVSTSEKRAVFGSPSPKMAN